MGPALTPMTPTDSRKIAPSWARRRFGATIWIAEVIRTGGKPARNLKGSSIAAMVQGVGINGNKPAHTPIASAP